MRVLLDESIPRQLAARLPGHDVETVVGRGWAGMRNGQLLRTAAGEFDVFVTGDQGLQYQQNLSTVGLGIVVIAARDNRVETILLLGDRILAAVNARGGASRAVAVSAAGAAPPPAPSSRTA